MDTLINESSVQNLVAAANTHGKNVAARELGNQLVGRATALPSQINFFFWYPDKDVEVHSFDSSVSSYTNGMEIIRRHKETGLSELPSAPANQWRYFAVNDTEFLLKSYSYRGRSLLCWIPCDSLFQPLYREMLTDKGEILCLDESGLPFSDGEVPANNGDRYVYQIPLARSDVTLCLVDRAPYSMTAMLFPLAVVFLIVLMVVAYAGYSLFYLNTYIQRPLNDLGSIISEFSRNREAAKRSGIREVNDALDAFDEMQDQLEKMKIDIYEEKLRHSRTELQYYQLQIKPHFFVNCFSILYAMAEKGNYQGIQKLCLKLSSYVRYHFTSSFDLIPLRDELTPVEDYLDIQNIRHRTNSQLRREVDGDLLSCRIPPMLLITFVENSIKYAVPKSEELSIELDIAAVSSSRGERLQLLISDNGAGIDPERAEQLNRGNIIVDKGGKHVGISNVRHRLSLLFGEDWFLEVRQCSEHPGTTVEIVLPMVREDVTEDEDIAGR